MAAPFLVQPELHPLESAPRPSRPSRPHLVVLPGGADAVRPRPVRPVRPVRPAESLDRRLDARRRMYLQRRIGVGVVAVIALLVLAVVVPALVGSVTGATAAPAAGSYEVSAGETLWEIAGTLDPGADRRAVVALLADANGGSTVRAGQRLVIPSEVMEMVG